MASIDKALQKAVQKAVRKDSRVFGLGSATSIGRVRKSTFDKLPPKRVEEPSIMLE
jgi:hypothetical protein